MRISRVTPWRACGLAVVVSIASIPPLALANDFDLPVSTVSSGGDADPAPYEEDDPRFYDEALPEQSDSVIYVVDRSASMSLPVEPFLGLDGNVVQNGTRLDYVKTELKRSISALPEDYTFNIVVYDECVEQWRPERQRASAENKAAAMGWLDTIVPWGWTNTGGATAQALGDRDNQVILLLSDGAPNFLDCAQTYVADFETHRRVIRSANSQQAIVNTFGLGLDPETRSFLAEVARDNDGTFREIGQ
ncbi:MAG: hypothetical protein KatS3mg102_1423 [Planctomycetota bacterium]|nr:MAG: hypothetical protein KatS3mg102_1423 [Planctomycetota bacterium]